LVSAVARQLCQVRRYIERCNLCPLALIVDLVAFDAGATAKSNEHPDGKAWQEWNGFQIHVQGLRIADGDLPVC
jgi:hypothetical protein